MTIKQIIENMETEKVKCIYFGKDGNSIITRNKDLYNLENIAGFENFNLFVEVRHYEYHDNLYLYHKLDSIGLSRSIGYLQEEITIEKLKTIICDYEYLHKDGFMRLVKKEKEDGHFIDLLKIEIIRLLQGEEVAAEYKQYRLDYYAKKEEEEAKERDARAQEEKEAKEKATKEFNDKLIKAEKAIANSEEVYNDNISLLGNDTTLILALMKKHDIKVPLKTQGWINKALASITFKDGKDGKHTYSYYNSSKDSTVFMKYLNELITAIKTEHNTLNETELKRKEEDQATEEEKQAFIASITEIEFLKIASQNVNRYEFDLHTRKKKEEWKSEPFEYEEVKILSARMYKALKVENIETLIRQDSILLPKDYYEENKRTKISRTFKRTTIYCKKYIDKNNATIYEYTKRIDGKDDLYAVIEIL